MIPLSSLRGLSMIALWLVLACTPKVAPAATADVVELPRADATEQAAFETMAGVLSERSGEDPAFAQGAALAEALVDGVADPAVRTAAAELLEWLATADLSGPVPEPAPVPDGLAADTRATEASLAVQIPIAREALRRGDYDTALDALSPFRDGPGWDAAVPYWEEAVDGYVARERERAGERFVEAKRLEGAERIAALEEVRATLARLLEDFPDSPYAEPLRENLERVERAIEASSD